MAERVGPETSNLEVADSNPKRNKVLLIGDLFLFFLISLYKATLFCRVDTAQLRLCVETLWLSLQNVEITGTLSVEFSLLSN